MGAITPTTYLSLPRAISQLVETVTFTIEEKKQARRA